MFSRLSCLEELLLELTGKMLPVLQLLYGSQAPANIEKFMRDETLSTPRLELLESLS
jgi:hypothetical protein